MHDPIDLSANERSAKAVGFARAIRDVVEMIQKGDHLPRWQVALMSAKIAEMPNPYEKEESNLNIK